eukprot:10244928-Alexandrium_andersonii.AAC.1
MLENQQRVGDVVQAAQEALDAGEEAQDLSKRVLQEAKQNKRRKKASEVKTARDSDAKAASRYADALPPAFLPLLGYDCALSEDKKSFLEIGSSALAVDYLVPRLLRG